MNYNRWEWQPVQQPELYHYGVKGMKWGRHKSASLQTSGSNGGGLINPVDAVQEAWWQFEDDSGITDYYKQKKAKRMYESGKGKSWEARVKQQYEKARKKFYKTPIGKAAKYVDAGKAAVETFASYVRNN